ncbi:MAG: lamin tail domain-containing protein [Planctomycetes bacterium]|nr:lamin tail domain-containing protein [Planctomycetota bacterium]
MTSSTTGGTTSGSTGNTNTATPAVDLTQVALTNNSAKMDADVAALVINVASTGTAGVQFAGFTVTASGTVDETELGALNVYGDDNKNGVIDQGEPIMATVAGPAFNMNDGMIQVTLANPITIAAGADLQLIVALEGNPTVNGIGKIGETVELSITAAIDLDVTSGGQSLTPNGAFPMTSQPTTLFLNDHLLISELVYTPTAAEYIEIFNPTGQTVDLSNYYLTDQSDSTLNNTYYKLPAGTFDSGNTADFIVRFPPNARIASGETITVAISGVDFQTTYNTAATYSCKDAAGSSIDMLVPVGTSWAVGGIAPFATLFDSGESVVLFFWDGQTDLVQDVDYVFFGSAASVGSYNLQWDKTGVSVDGPDADTTPSQYLPETPIAQQGEAQTAPAPNNAIQRTSYVEGTETQNAGNGITGHDETSEDVGMTFTTGVPTPGQP